MSEGRSLTYSQVLSCRPYVSKELTIHLSKDGTPWSLPCSYSHLWEVPDKDGL